MTTTATWSTTVAAPPDAVFAVLCDFDRHHEWSQTAYRIEKVSDGPIGLGTRFNSYGWLPGKGKEYLNEVTITAFEPGRRLAFDAVDPNGPTVPSEFILTPVAQGTKVERTMTMPKPPGFQGLLWPIIFPAAVKPAIQKNLTTFGAVVEGR